MLLEFNLSCDDSYALLKKGVYPIDGKHINALCDTNLTLEQIYTDAFNTKQIPHYQSFCGLTIFILCNDTIFNRKN